jgi:hypothetical protein
MDIGADQEEEKIKTAEDEDSPKAFCIDPTVLRSKKYSLTNMSDI